MYNKRWYLMMLIRRYSTTQSKMNLPVLIMIMTFCSWNNRAVVMSMKMLPACKRYSVFPLKSMSKSFTFKETYNRLQQSFIEANISEPEVSARYILSHVMSIGYRYSNFLRNLESNISLTAAQLDDVKTCEGQRLKQMPIQYILGNWDFFGLQFECKPPLLIPRPETEELIELIVSKRLLDNVSLQQKDAFKILDIGAGTGVIGLSLLYHYRSLNVTCTALDINPVAVEVSHRNAARLGLSSRYKCELVSFLEFASSNEQFDIIISNPPYIPSREINCLDLEVREYEDRRALDGGDDGLDIVRDIIIHGSKLLRPTGTQEIWLEVDRSHPDMIAHWMRGQALGVELLEKINDLSGNPRFVRLKKGH